METLQEELDNEFTGKTVTITPSADKKEWTIKVDNVEVAVTAGKYIPQVATLPSADGTTPYFPSDSFSQVDGTDLSTGLVITDEVDEDGKSIGNEYVWIEVPRTATTYGSSFNLDYDFDNMTDEQKNTAYTAIATALRNYVSDIISVGTSSDSEKTTTKGSTDVWCNECGISSQSAYTELYNKMLKSTYENGGFWIGRYEASMTSTRTSREDSINGLIPLSQIDLIPIFYVTCSQAQTIANNASNKGDYNSSIMFGIQWDLVLKYLSNKGTTKRLLTEDSSSWGNYNEVEITIERGRYWSYADSFPTPVFKTFETTYTKSSSGAPVCLSTGAIPKSMAKQNIYDFAGNMIELTLETSRKCCYGSWRCFLLHRDNDACFLAWLL